MVFYYHKSNFVTHFVLPFSSIIIHASKLFFLFSSPVIFTKIFIENESGKKNLNYLLEIKQFWK